MTERVSLAEKQLLVDANSRGRNSIGGIRFVNNQVISLSFHRNSIARQRWPMANSRTRRRVSSFVYFRLSVGSRVNDTHRSTQTMARNLSRRAEALTKFFDLHFFRSLQRDEHSYDSTVDTLFHY